LRDNRINSQGVPFFCELGANKMAKIDPATMAIAEFKLPESARPRRLAIASDEQVYFTDYKSGNLGRLNPATGAVKMWPSPGGPESAPYGITITKDGSVWYSESGVKPNTINQIRSIFREICPRHYSVWWWSGAKHGGYARWPSISGLQRRGQNRNRGPQSQVTNARKLAIETVPPGIRQQMRLRLLLQLAQQFTPDFLTPAVPFDSVNNGVTLTAHYF
jgi:hypothetical protein